MGEEPRGGNTVAVTLTLQREDDTALTGSVTSPEGEADISDAVVDGDNISFSVIREYEGYQITETYNGWVEGDVIHFSLRVQGGRLRGASVSEFDAKRIN